MVSSAGTYPARPANMLLATQGLAEEFGKSPISNLPRNKRLVRSGARVQHALDRARYRRLRYRFGPNGPHCYRRDTIF